MQIQIDRNSAQPLYDQVAQAIQHRIRSGALPCGTRLPTVRELSRQLGVTRLTVHSAYSELQAGGWVEATVGRGTFVAARSEAPPIADFGREISAHGLINDMLRLAQLPGMRSLAMADAAPELFPTREFQRALEDALVRDTSHLLGYTASQGDPVLRLVLAGLLRERGISPTPDEIVITAGATQGLALAARVLAQPGDAVIVEQPTYLGALNIFRSHGLRLVGVPVDAEGMVVEALEPLILAHRPRFIYTIPVFQNPSGVCLSTARRHTLLAVAQRHGIPIVEDDIYNQLSYDAPTPPALQADDRSGSILMVGSFSKSLLPGIRMGYIAAAPQYIAGLVATKQAIDLCSPLLNQRALALFIERGWLTNHLRRSVPRYRERRDALHAAMQQHFPSSVRWSNPRGGFSTWVELPPGASTTDLYLAAVERGVAFTPGDVFFAGVAPRPYMRLAFSVHPPSVLSDVVQVLGELLTSHLGRRAFTRPPLGDYVPLV